MANPTLIDLQLTDEELEDILTTACEGGSTYWARSDKHLSRALTEPVKVWDREDGSQLGELTKGKLLAAPAIMAEKCPRMFGELVRDRAAMDADAADAFVQCALLGELVYG